MSRQGARPLLGDGFIIQTNGKSPYGSPEEEAQAREEAAAAQLRVDDLVRGGGANFFIHPELRPVRHPPLKGSPRTSIVDAVS